MQPSVVLVDVTVMLVSRNLPIVPGNLGDALGAACKDRLEGGALRRASRRTAMYVLESFAGVPRISKCVSRGCVLCWLSASAERAVRGGTTPRPRSRGTTSPSQARSVDCLVTCRGRGIAPYKLARSGPKAEASPEALLRPRQLSGAEVREHDLEFVRTDLTSNECRVVNMRSASLCFARRIQSCGVSSHSVAGNVLRTARLKQDAYSNAAFET